MALEAHAKQMVNKRAGNAWRVIRCEYNADAVKKAIASLFNEAHESFRLSAGRAAGRRLEQCRQRLEQHRDLAEPKWLRAISTTYLAGINEIAPVSKHSAFEEQAEWRLVSPMTLPGDGDDEAFRAGKYSVIPYQDSGSRETATRIA